MTALDRAWRGEASFVSALLTPLSWAYGVGARAHRASRPHARAELPVVSVGNLVVGGAGKTPVTLEIAKRLFGKGNRVAILSRGYGRIARELVVVDERTSAGECGDEPLWLARKLPQAIVIASADRLEGARRAKELGATLALLDDGFSHHALERDDDVLVVDRALGFGNRRLLPAGPLREPVSELHRATVAWLTRCETEHDAAPPELRGKPLVRSRYRPTALATIDLAPNESIDSLLGRRVVAISGIARPEEFRRTLASLGAQLVRHRAFGDHHRFTPGEVEAIERDDAELFVTTEKDAMRLAPLVKSPKWRALAMDVEVVGDTSALDALVARHTR